MAMPGLFKILTELSATSEPVTACIQENEMQLSNMQPWHRLSIKHTTHFWMFPFSKW